MQVSQIQNTFQVNQNKAMTKEDEIIENFDSKLMIFHSEKEKKDDYIISGNVVNETDVQKFKEALSSKGAMKFLSDFEIEKIDKLIEEYREKLLEELGNSPEALKQIEEMLKEYKKKLLEEMQTKLEDKESTPSLNTDAMLLTLLKMQNKDKAPLDALIKSTDIK